MKLKLKRYFDDEKTVITEQSDTEKTHVDPKPTSQQEQEIREAIREIDPNKIALVFAQDPQAFQVDWDMIFGNESHATGLVKALYHYIEDLPLNMIEDLLEEINSIEVFRYLIGTSTNAYLAYKYNNKVYIYGVMVDLINSFTCVAILKQILENNPECDMDQAQVNNHAVRDYFDFVEWTEHNGGEQYAIDCFRNYIPFDFNKFLIIHKQVLGRYNQKIWSPAGFLPIQ